MPKPGDLVVVIPSDIKWTEYYSDKGLCRVVARTIVNFNLNYFYEAYIIKHIDEFRQLGLDIFEGKLTSEEIENRALPFVENELLDSIRICLFFENVMKARLLLQGKIIHVLKDTPKTRTLLKEQKKRAIDGKDLSIHGITEDDISDKTVAMKTMLDRYNDVINLGPDLHKVVSRLNESRNKLHLSASQDMGVGTKYTGEYELLLHNANKWKAWLDQGSDELKRKYPHFSGERILSRYKEI